MAQPCRFLDVTRAEAPVLVERRRWLARKHGRKDDPASWAITVEQMLSAGKPVEDERGIEVPALSSPQQIVGLALSGGGVRSASFCLGVLQGLDAVVPDNKDPQILDAVDYLSTVSGGGYIGCSLVSSMFNTWRFPFTSKLDQMETVGTQHLRDFSNYLVPDGLLDAFVGLAVVLRGLLINLFLVLGVLLLAATATAWLYPDENSLRGTGLDHAGLPSYGHSAIALAVLAALAGTVTLSALRLDGRSPRSATGLADRERAGTLIAIALLAALVIGAVAVQPVVLAGLFDAAHLALCPIGSGQAGWLGRRLHAIGLGTGAPWGSLLAVTGALWAFGTKLVKVAQATFTDRSWSGFTAQWGSRIAIAVGATALPLAIWATYLSLSFAAIAWVAWPGAAQCCSHPGPPASPLWMSWLGLAQGELPLVYLLVGSFLLALSLLTPPNANSLHGYYRDRLSRAFLWDEEVLRCEAKRRECQPPGLWETLFGLRERRPGDDGADRLKLSALTAREPTRCTTADATWPPYLLINAAVNLEGSKYANRRGRNADAFTFAALHTGSAATGYVETATLEKADDHIDLATAMAISGAAASANMGASTIKPLTFSLALLNIRLGYWLPNPRRLGEWRRRLGQREQVWPLYFGMEALGLLDEWSRNVYLTDGGHFDNLGLYELLKRQCRIIIAADAEADPPMNFESLIRLERCARIDLGVRIDLPWEDLRRWSRKITVDHPHGPDDDPTACIGPHVAVGRIRYTDKSVEDGVLIYIKACITGDENDLIRDYRRRNPDFPHETTLDQFFTEEQFEVYRALGFHATKSFFSGQDRFGFSPSHTDADWMELVRSALKRLNVPKDAVGRIVAQQARKPARDLADVT